MTLWIVTGLTDARWCANIAANADRMASACDARLVVVENGAQWTGPFADVVQSERGVSAYMNAGLRYVRRHAKSDDWVLKCDSDDYYGAPRAAEIAASDASVLGSATVYVRTASGRLWLADFGVVPGSRVPENIAVHGPTIACRVGIAPDVPEPPHGRTWGEDLAWVQAMRDDGRHITALSPAGFAWQRRDEGHAFPVPDAELRHLWRCPAWDLGDWDPDVVDGRAPPAQRISMPINMTSRRATLDRLLRRTAT